MPTKYLNQDFVENFFSQVRYRNGHPDVTCKKFRIIFKFLLNHHLMDPSRGKHTNCSVDGGKFLFLIQNKLYEKVFPPDELDEEPDKYTGNKAKKSKDLTENFDVEENSVMPQAFEEYVPEENSGDTKFSSYMARRLVLESQKCGTCAKIYSTEEKERRHRVLEYTENKQSSYRFYTSSEMMQILVHNSVVAFDQTLRDEVRDKHLGNLIAQAISSVLDFLFSASVHYMMLYTST